MKCQLKHLNFLQNACMFYVKAHAIHLPLPSETPPNLPGRFMDKFLVRASGSVSDTAFCWWQLGFLV